MESAYPPKTRKLLYILKVCLLFPDPRPERQPPEPGDPGFLQRAQWNPEASRIHAGQRQR